MKLIKALVVLLVMAGIAAPSMVIAEDRLSLSGEMRVRGWHTDVDIDDFDDSDSTETWADQRLRIAGKLAVAEGVSITFRTDITESNWGSGNVNGSGRTTVCKDVDDDTQCSDFQSQHWDRAHIDLVMGDFHLRAGQQYNAFGKTYALDNQSNGLTLFYNGIENTKANVFVMLVDDNGGKDEGDAFLSGATIRPMFGDVQTAFFVGNYNDGQNDDGSDGGGAGADVTLVGAYVAAMLGPVNFTGEFDYFTGDAGWDSDLGDNLDAYGTQVWLDGSMAATDAFTVGAQLFYGAGDDEDVQYTHIGSGFGGWDPLLDVGTSLSNEQINYDRPFNVAEFALGAEGDSVSLGSLGSVGGRLYVGFKASEDLNFGASVAYAQEEEDKYAELDVLLLAGGMVYQILPNASFQVQLQYKDGNVTVDDEDIDNDFDAFEMGSGLFVKF